MKRACLVLVLASACGGAPTPAPRPAPEPAPTPTAERPQTPFERAAAVPAGPRMVVDIDLDALRPTPLFVQLRESMEGDDPEERVGRQVVDRASTVRLAAYGRPPRLAMIATGALAGLVDEVVASLRSDGLDPTASRQLGFDAFYVSHDMVIAQTAPDTVVIVYPEHLPEVLRTAAGHAPATPLPPPMRALHERAAVRDAPMRMVFSAVEGEGDDDPLSPLIDEAGAVAVAGRIEGSELVAITVARAPSEARAAALARQLEDAARAVSGSDGLSPTLTTGLQGATVRVEGRWIEIEVRFAPDDIDAFMELVDPLDR